jgi:CheY-like chemotaxis protein/anti-sigma regulatory factor (Ser/Thr protein kinase)
MAKTYGFRVHLKNQVEVQPLAEEILLLLFQSARELLFNVLKHAGVKEARLELSRRDGMIMLTVEDNGNGFEADKLRMEGGESVGFGLFSMRERLSLMGGQMEIKSAPGRGSRIRVTAPLSSVTSAADRASIPGQKPEATPIPVEKKPGPDGREMKIRIMLVDDHEIVRQGVANLLRKERDFEIVGEASEGESAVGLTREVRPHIVLMDVNMPRMDGIEATRIIHREFADVKIIGFSIHDDEVQRNAMLQAGAVDYFVKRGSSGKLIEMIRASCA